MPAADNFRGLDLFRKACAYISQSEADSPDLKAFALDWIDALLVEALPYENARRQIENDPARPQLATAPVLESLEAPIPYDDAICRVALPYGLASQFFIDDAEDYRAQDFRNRYIAALMETAQAEEELIKDVY